MKRTPLRRISKAQQERLRIYGPLRKQYLKEHPVCELPECTAASTDIHHTKKPRKTYMNDVGSWLAVCRSCHSRIEGDKAWARENGYLENF